MLKSLSITNFMSHKHSKLEFCPGMNVIVGPTDQGKSAVMSAILWAMQNKPSGDVFRSDWGGNTEVSLEIDDFTLTRKKTQGTNSYYLNEQQFTGFGTNVPSIIEEALKISDINIHHQGQPPFLISEPSGRLAQYLNDLVGLNQLDNLISILASWHREAKSEMIQKQSEFSNLKKIVQTPRYTCLTSAEALLIKIQKKEKTMKEKETKLTQLDTVIYAVQKAKEVLDSIPIEKMSKAKEFLNKARFSLKTKEEKELLLENITNLMSEMTKLQQEKNNLIINLQELEFKLHETLETLGVEICPTCGQEIRHDNSL